MRTRAAVSLLFGLIAAAADAPLRIADLVRFLQAGVSERAILSEVRERGVGEPFDAEKEQALRSAGATDAVVDAVRSAAPQPPPPPPVVPRAADPGPPVVAQQGGPGPPSFGVSTRTVRVPVSVLDKKGKPVTTLAAADFRVAEEGRAQEITFFGRERKPLRLVVALDVSGSMQDKVDEVADALKHFLELLEAEDEVLVLAFSDGVQVLQGFTSDRRRLGRVLDSLQPAGGTALFDAVIDAIRRVAPASVESKAIVVVTDGLDTASAASFRDAREAARRAEVPIYSIGIGHPESGGHLLGGVFRGFRGRRPGGHGGTASGGRADFDPQPLLDLAEETGGRAEILKEAEHHHRGGVDLIKQAAEGIALSLRHRYLLAYEPSVDGKPGWREIQVKVDRPSVSVRARKGYYLGLY